MIQKKILSQVIIILLLELLIFNTLLAETLVDTIYDNSIRTIRLYKEGWELSVPIIELNSNDKLVIEFDDLSAQKKDLWYTIVHCNRNWEPDNLPNYEFFDGFENNPIRDFAFSTTTVVNYIHYRFTIPDADCKIKVSGNYLLKVFSDNNPDNVLFTRKFYVVENRSNIQFQIIRPEIPKYMMRYHQFKASVTPMVNDYHDLRTEINTLIMQNFNPLTLKKCYLTELRQNSTLIYDDPDSNIFLGGNEFRNVDLKSIRYQSPRIQSITYLNNFYEVVLHPDEWRQKKPYFFDKDLNGKFVVANSRGTDNSRDADYVMVYFTLPTIEPIIGGNLYLIGAFNNWQCNEHSKLKYNSSKFAYETNLLLKQGYYNYQIILKSDEGNVDLSYVEGSHYETENDYYLLVYYQSTSLRYERLIGYAIANSLYKK